MPGLTPLGVVHTAISLVALGAGIVALIRYREIPAKLFIGKLYIWTTVVTCLTMLLDAPGPLILISAVIGFIGTVIFPAALYLLNHRLLPPLLPPWARPSRFSACLLWTSFAAYLILAIAYLGEVL